MNKLGSNVSSSEDQSYANVILEDLSSDVNMEERTVEDYKESSPDWSKLPYLVVENIYSFLSKKDQSQMSVVCQNWSKVYSSPVVWEKITFHIPHLRCTLDICPIVKSVQNYGNIIHFVNINYRRYQSQFDVARRQMKLLLQVLSFHTQLSTIAFTDLRYLFNRLNNEASADIFSTILNLLVSQSELKSVEFKNAQFSALQSADILKVLCSKKKLKSLLLEQFIREEIGAEVDVDMTSAPQNFNTLLNLHTLEIDYSKIFENIMNSSFEYASTSGLPHRTGTLQRIKINCFGSKRINYQGISSVAWKYFVKTFPRLKIDLLYDAECILQNEMEIFIVPNMPIRKLNVKLHRRNMKRISPDISYLLNHLVYCEINKFLEELSIAWSQNNTNFDQHIISFLQCCPKLRQIELFLLYPIHTLYNVFEFWCESGIMSVNIVHITVENVPPDEIEFYTSLFVHYGPSLEAMGLTLVLVSDTYPTERRWRI